jgi:predicted AAA+ superfamily ATPase
MREGAAMQTLTREHYLNQIAGFIDKPFIKIITGLRRSGKSEFLKTLRDEIRRKTDADHILYINFEDADYEDIVSSKELNAFFKAKMTDSRTYYVFLDEIQEVKRWEKAINSLRLRNADIYITGSNSKIMSSELASLLGGRTVSFNMHTLSFSEFIDFRKRMELSSGTDVKAELDAYIRLGGFPSLSVHAYETGEARKIVQDINSTALFRDVVRRHDIRRPQLLDKIIAFLYDNVGNLMSITSVSKYLKSQGRSADPETIGNYLMYLEDAFVVKRAQRYDIKGKRLLETNGKYYLGNHALQYAIREMRQDKVQGVLENIVFMELVRRGYRVFVGKLNDKEIDFIAENGGGRKMYIQVCMTFAVPDVRQREFVPLLAVRDSYPKYVVSLDPFAQTDECGVQGIHLADFLLSSAF